MWKLIMELNGAKQGFHHKGLNVIYFNDVINSY